MDTLISNGTVVTAARSFQASVGIKDGVIAGIFEKGAEPKARETIDATGLHVLPGFIDMHSHHREGSQKPGFEYKETIETATRQCAAGGITTSVGMPNVQPPPNTLELLEKQYECYRRSAIVGWNFNPLTTQLDEMPAMAKTGIAGFKLFMVADTGRGYPHMPGLGVHDTGKILQTMRMCKEIDMPLMVHPHNQSLMETIAQGLAAPPPEGVLAENRERRRREPSPAVVDLLKTLLRLKAEEARVAPRLIATAEDIERLAANEDDRVMALTGWRRAVYGEDAIALRKGELAIALENGEAVVVELEGQDLARE